MQSCCKKEAGGSSTSRGLSHLRSCWAADLALRLPHLQILARKRREYRDMVPDYYDLAASGVEQSGEELGALRQVGGICPIGQGSQQHMCCASFPLRLSLAEAAQPACEVLCRQSICIGVPCTAAAGHSCYSTRCSLHVVQQNTYAVRPPAAHALCRWL